MKKLLLTKSLLALLMLFVGTNVWAATGDVTTNADIDFSNAITGTYSVSGNVGSMTWSQQWTYTPTINDGVFYFGNFNGGVVELQNANIKSKDKVTISFELAFSKLSGRHVGFQLLDKDGNSLLQQWFDAYNGDFDDANPLNLDWSKMYRGSNTIIWDRRVYFTIVFDYDTKKVTTSTKCYLSGTGKAATEATAEGDWTTTTPIAKFVLQGNLNNDGRPSAIDNLLIKTTEGDYSAATAKYTVKYMCGEDEIKTAAEREGNVQSSVSLLTSDKANFTLEDESKRYIYVSDDAEGKTVAEDGLTVVTVTFREAAKYSYTATSSYNENALAWTESGSVWEDLNTVTIQFPRFQTYETTTLVEAPYGNNGDLTKTITISEDNYLIDYEYNATNVNNLYMFSEAENLGTGLSTNATIFTGRVSNKAIIHGNKGDLMTLPAGKYVLTLGAIGGDNNTHKVNYVVYKEATPTEEAVEHNENNIILEGTVTANTLNLIQSSEFTLTEETTISFTCSDPASNRGIDLVYVQSYPTSVTATIGEAGWATLFTDKALDFTGTGVKAYTVTSVSNNTVELQAFDQIPAYCGVVLQGAEGSYEIPILANGSVNDAGLLKGSATEATAYNAYDGYTIYILAKVNDGKDVQFVPCTSGSIAAGKAFLSIQNGNQPTAKAMQVVFASETTGIDNVNVSVPVPVKRIQNGQLVIEKNGKTYNAAGQLK